MKGTQKPELSKSIKIVIMKQDIGRGVALIDRTLYLEKCLYIRYQSACQITYRPNKENWRKNLTSFKEN